MLVESFLSAYMRHQSAGILAFKQGEGLRVTSPPPSPGTSLLLYIHIPFCNELCPYCSFNRVRLDKPMADEYFDALSDELKMYRDAGYVFNALYVGGGTPTVLPDRLSRLLAFAKSVWPISEISVETNPDHLVPEITEVLSETGVNRLSVGVQSFSDDILKSVNRLSKYGSSSSIQHAIDHTMGKFDTLNVDMIFNFPYQTEADIRHDISVLESLQPDQVTWYPLMASQKVRKSMRKKWGRTSPTKERDLYSLISTELAGQGYARSTAWCFSKEGDGMIDEYVIDHNEYAGAGSGSFGYVNGTMYSNTFSIRNYIDTITAGEWPVERQRVFTPTESARYLFLMKLFGGSLDLEAARVVFGEGFTSRLWKELLFMKLTGAVKKDGQVLNLSGPGYYYLVIMMREFFTGVNNFRSAMMPDVTPDHAAVE